MPIPHILRFNQFLLYELILLSPEHIIPEGSICNQQKAGDNKRVLQSVGIADNREDERTHHLAESHDRNQNAGASTDVFLFEQPGDEHKNQGCQKPVSKFMNDPKQKREVYIAREDHEDVPQAGEEHGGEKKPLVDFGIVPQKDHAERGKGENKKRDGNVERKLQSVQVKGFL